MDDDGAAGGGADFDGVDEGDEGVGGGDGPAGAFARFFGAESGAADSVGLAGAHADEDSVFDEDDGVGLDVLGDDPSGTHVGFFGGGELALADDVKLLVVGGVAVLDEEAAAGGADLEAGAARVTERCGEDAEVFRLLLEVFEGVFVVAAGR